MQDEVKETPILLYVVISARALILATITLSWSLDLIRIANDTGLPVLTSTLQSGDSVGKQGICKWSERQAESMGCVHDGP